MVSVVIDDRSYRLCLLMTTLCQFFDQNIYSWYCSCVARVLTVSQQCDLMGTGQFSCPQSIILGLDVLTELRKALGTSTAAPIVQ